MTVPTRPDADCFGPPGGSGAEFTYDKPNALSLLATAGRTTKSVAPLALTDQFGFGLGVCGIGGEQATDTSFWYLKSNHEEADGRRRPARRSTTAIRCCYYLSPDNFPNPNPAELELQAPARAQAGQPFAVTVIEHKCVTDPDRSRPRCTRGPAAGVTVAGGDAPATTGADGTAQLTADSRRRGQARRHPRRRHPVRGARRPASARSSTTARRRAASGSSAARSGDKIKRHQGRRLRSARAAAMTGSTPARAAPT